MIQLQIKNWSELYCNTDVNSCYGYFLNEFVVLLNECCPVVKRSQKTKWEKPWFTNGLINACRKKNLLYNKWLAKKMRQLNTAIKNIKIN